MSGGKAKRRAQKPWVKKRLLVPTVRCFNCGEYAPHFVPPSLGDPGFYICQKAGE